MTFIASLRHPQAKAGGATRVVGFMTDRRVVAVVFAMRQTLKDP